MKAWRCEVSGFPQKSIVGADSRAQAKYRNWAAAKDAGFDVRFGEIRVTRAPEFDAADLRRWPILEEYVDTGGSGGGGVIDTSRPVT